MLIVSGAFMLLIWIAVAGALTFCVIQQLQSDYVQWNIFEIVTIGVLLLVLGIIPIQLMHYFREWRILNSD